MISCTPDGFRIDMEVDTTIHFATYSNISPRKVYEVTGHVWKGKAALNK